MTIHGPGFTMRSDLYDPSFWQPAPRPRGRKRAALAGIVVGIITGVPAGLLTAFAWTV